MNAKDWIVNLCAVALLITGAGAVWMVVQDNRRLEALVQRLAVEKVDGLPDLSLVDESGSFLSLHGLFEGTSVVMFVNSSCEACDTVIPQWQQIDSAIDDPSYRFVLLSLDPLSTGVGYRQQKGLSWPIHFSPNPYAWTQAGIVTLPLTLVVSEAGGLLGKWSGVLTSRDRREIIDVLLQSGQAGSGSASGQEPVSQ